MKIIAALLLVCLTGCASMREEEKAAREQRIEDWYRAKVSYYGDLCQKQGFISDDALKGCILTRMEGRY